VQTNNPVGNVQIEGCTFSRYGSVDITSGHAVIDGNIFQDGILSFPGNGTRTRTGVVSNNKFNGLAQLTITTMYGLKIESNFFMADSRLMNHMISIAGSRFITIDNNDFFGASADDGDSSNYFFINFNSSTSYGISITNNRFSNHNGWAIHRTGSSQISNSVLSDNTFSNCRAATIYGAYLNIDNNVLQPIGGNNAWDGFVLNVSNSTIRGTISSGYQTLRPIVLTGSFNTVSNNTVTSALATALSLSGRANNVNGNTFAANGSSGNEKQIVVNSGAQYNLISNNILLYEGSGVAGVQNNSGNSTNTINNNKES